MILNTTKAEGETLPNLRKAAILLVALGEGSSAELLQQLNEEEVQKVSHASPIIRGLQKVPLASWPPCWRRS